MCGIYFRFDRGATATPITVDYPAIQQMLQKRGPDQMVSVCTIDKRVEAHHSRLVIRGDSQHGAQPVLNSEYLILFNGELYNTEKLIIYERLEVNAGFSDTDILVELINRYGPRRGIEKLRGMYAIVIYHFESGATFYARDPSGQKPLFLRDTGSSLELFSAIFQGYNEPIQTPSLDLISKHVINYGFIRHNATVFPNIVKVAPGKVYELSATGELTISDLDHGSDISDSRRIRGLSWQQAFDDLFLSTVERTTVSDYPMSLSLSGGTDSTAIAVALASRGNINLSAYAIQFEGSNFDESEIVQHNANVLGIKLTTIEFSCTNFLDYLQIQSDIFDEPFADHSQAPLFTLCRAVRAGGVKVLMGGDGGDEVMCGYNRHRFLPYFLSMGPAPFKILLEAINWLSNKNQTIFSALDRLFPGVKSEDKYRKLLLLASTLSKSQHYGDLLAVAVSEELRIDFECAQDLEEFNIHRGKSPAHIARQIMSFDRNDYLPNDIFVKSDRVSMYNGVEIRTPFLDSEIIAFMNRYMSTKSFSPFSGKLFLRSFIRRYAPEVKLSKLKMGFTLPLSAYMQDSNVKSYILETLSTAIRGVPKGSLIYDKINQVVRCRANDISAEYLYRLFSICTWVKRWM